MTNLTTKQKTTNSPTETDELVPKRIKRSIKVKKIWGHGEKFNKRERLAYKRGWNEAVAKYWTNKKAQAGISNLSSESIIHHPTPPTETVSDCCGAKTLFHNSLSIDKRHYTCTKCNQVCANINPPIEPTVPKKSKKQVISGATKIIEEARKIRSKYPLESIVRDLLEMVAETNPGFSQRCYELMEILDSKEDYENQS